MPKEQIHMLLGPERGAKDKYIRDLITNLTKEYKQEPEAHRFYPFDTDMNEVVTVLQNGTLFSACRLATIPNCEEIKKAGDIKSLEGFCKSIPKEVTLVFISDSVSVDKRLTALVPGKNKRIFWEMFEGQKREWVQGFFKSHNLTIESKGIDTLLDLVENNTEELKTACQNLFHYFPPGSLIREEDIENFIHHSKGENVFTLFERFLHKDMASVLDALAAITLSNDTDLVYLHSGLMWQIRRLRQIKVAIAYGEPSQAALEKYGIRGKRNQKVSMEGLKRFELWELEEIQREAETLDATLRDLRKDMQLVALQLFLSRVLKGGISPVET